MDLNQYKALAEESKRKAEQAKRELLFTLGGILTGFMLGIIFLTLKLN